MSKVIFRKIGGRIVPLRVRSGVDVASDVLQSSAKIRNRLKSFIQQKGLFKAVSEADPKRLLFHETTKDAAKAIRKDGFNLNNMVRSVRDNDTPISVFTKRSSDPIGLIKKEDRTTMAVFDKSRRTLYSGNREDLKNYFSWKNPRIKELYRKEQQIDKVMGAKFDKLYNDRRAWRNNDFTDVGAKMSKYFKAKMDKVLYRWRKVQTDVAVEQRKLNTEVMRKEGFDSLSFRDEGSFKRFAMTKAFLNPDQVVPLRGSPERWKRIAGTARKK